MVQSGIAANIKGAAKEADTIARENVIDFLEVWIDGLSPHHRCDEHPSTRIRDLAQPWL